MRCSRGIEMGSGNPFHRVRRALKLLHNLTSPVRIVESSFLSSDCSFRLSIYGSASSAGSTGGVVNTTHERDMEQSDVRDKIDPPFVYF